MKGEVICNTTGKPSTQTKENEEIQLETTHLLHASAQCVAKFLADLQLVKAANVKRSPGCRGPILCRSSLVSCSIAGEGHGEGMMHKSLDPAESQKMER